jgi:hypothetical protein
MMGAGLYTLVGFASTTAGVWVATCLPRRRNGDGVQRLLVRRAQREYPSRSGAAQFLIRSFGDDVARRWAQRFQFLG